MYMYNCIYLLRIGGEYESLVLDCPLFENFRIQLQETEVILDDEDSTVGNLRIGKAYIVHKQQDNHEHLPQQSLPHGDDHLDGFDGEEEEENLQLLHQDELDGTQIDDLTPQIQRYIHIYLHAYHYHCVLKRVCLLTYMHTSYMHTYISRALPYVASIPTGLGQSEMCYPLSRSLEITEESIRIQVTEVIQLLKVHIYSYLQACTYSCV